MKTTSPDKRFEYLRKALEDISKALADKNQVKIDWSFLRKKAP